MNIWQGRIVGVLTLGGSAIALAAIVSGVPILTLRGLTLLIVSIFAVVFVYGIVVGVLIIEKAEKSLPLALPFWLAQVPVFQSAWLSYGLYTGAKFDVLFQSDLDISFVWSGGAHFTFYLFPGDAAAVGVNVVAILVCYMIWKNRKRRF